MTAARAALVLAFAVALSACCGTVFPGYDIGDISAKLSKAGYVVVAAPVPNNLLLLAREPSIERVTCIDAQKAGATDKICVVRCTGRLACLDAMGRAGETYGVIHGGATLFVHQQCAMNPAWKPGSTVAAYDCQTARRVAFGP